MMFLKKKSVWTIAISFAILLIALGAVIGAQHKEMDELRVHNEVILSENKGLREDLQKEKEQHLISKDALQKLETRDESLKYGESVE